MLHAGNDAEIMNAIPNSTTLASHRVKGNKVDMTLCQAINLNLLELQEEDAETSNNLQKEVRTSNNLQKEQVLNASYRLTTIIYIKHFNISR